MAMPGSVSSENLAIATRHFIYSYIADVDMIARASIHSLEHLRDRIIDALNKLYHSTNNISTPTIITSNIDSIISQIVLMNHSIEHQHLVIPGTIIHLYSTDRVGIFTRKASYRACISTYNQFTQFIVHPRMWFDHFPTSYSTALTDVIENYDENLQDII